jgi:hypothetical protein
MRFILLLMVGALCLPVTSYTQDDDDDSYAMLESVYILPKVGHEDSFVDAVKAHNEKYHNADPYEATLYYIYSGNEAGWYVWEMGPMTFTDMDDRPTDQEGHDADWDTNIAPHVQKYGRTEYWRRNAEQSYSNDDDWNKLEIWWVDITRGEYYRFRKMMENIKKVHEKMDDVISVWNTQFNQGDGRDVAIVWPFAKWAEYDDDDWKIKAEYDAMFGEGEWENALEEWEEITKSVVQEIWVRE